LKLRGTWHEARYIQFEKKYGEILPMPPTPPTPPARKNSYELSAAQEVNRATISDNFEITDNKATMHLKNGKTEEYDLTNSAEREKFETKYGEIIEVGGTVEGATAPVKVMGTIDGHTVIAPVRIAGEGGVTFLNDEGDIITGEEEILVTITKKTTQQQLEEFVKRMKEKGIEIKFDNINYNDGILVSISGTIKFKHSSGSFKDSNGSFSATDFNKLILSTIKNGEHFYFKVRTTDNTQVI